MALAKDPTLLILDEPTTGLDATVEAEVLDLVAALRAEFGTAVLFISHNLGVIAKMCDRVGVLYAGALVEEGAGAGGVRRPAPPVHRRPAALHPARRRAQGPRPARHDPGLPAAARRRPAGLRVRRSLRARAGPLPREAPPVYDIGGGRRSRCHFHEQAHELPRATPADWRCAPIDADAEPVVRADDVRRRSSRRPRRPRARRRLGLALAGRDARPGRRVGQRQDDVRARAARAYVGRRGTVVELDGGCSPRTSASATREHVRALQIVFQNPDSALNRPHSVHRMLGRALVEAAPRPRRRARGAPARARRVGALRRALHQRRARRSSRAA